MEFHRDGLEVGKDDENVEQLVDGVAICDDDPGCGSCGDGIARSAGTGFGKLAVAVEQLGDCFHAYGAYPLQHFCAPGQDQHRRLPNCARRLVLNSLILSLPIPSLQVVHQCARCFPQMRH